MEASAISEGAAPGARSPRCLAIVPAFQERDAIAQVIADIRANAPVEIVVIDDGSGDGTAAEAVRAGARVITLPFNLGIGSAVQTGYMAAQEGDFDVAIQVDGDGQHPASEINLLISALVESGADLAIGSRFLGERLYRAPLARRLGIARLRSRRLGHLPRTGDGHDVRLPCGQSPRDRALRGRLSARLPRGRGGDHRAPGRTADHRGARGDARASGRPLVDHPGALGLLHAQGAHGRRYADAAAPGQAPGGTLTRITLVSLVVATLLLLLVLELVRRRRLQERYSVLWLATGGTLLILAAWPALLERIADTIGIASPPNALFVVALGFFLAVMLHFSLVISRLSEHTSRLAQRLALLEERVGSLPRDSDREQQG